MEKEVILSDGEPCMVRVLGLFELDDHAIGLNPAGVFMEEIKMAGDNIVRRPYVPPGVPPEEPPVSREKAEPGGAMWNAWEEFDLYTAYVAHRKKDAAIVSIYIEDVRRHIERNCISEEDARRIVEIADWHEVSRAAMGAQLTQEDLAAALAVTFQG